MHARRSIATLRLLSTPTTTSVIPRRACCAPASQGCSTHPIGPGCRRRPSPVASDRDKRARLKEAQLSSALLLRIEWRGALGIQLLELPRQSRARPPQQPLRLHCAPRFRPPRHHIRTCASRLRINSLYAAVSGSIFAGGHVFPRLSYSPNRCRARARGCCLGLTDRQTKASTVQVAGRESIFLVLTSSSVMAAPCCTSTSTATHTRSVRLGRRMAEPDWAPGQRHWARRRSPRSMASGVSRVAASSARDVFACGS